MEELIEKIRTEEKTRAKKIEGSVLKLKKFKNNKSAANRGARIGRNNTKRNNILNILKNLILKIEKEI